MLRSHKAAGLVFLLLLAVKAEVSSAEESSESSRPEGSIGDAASNVLKLPTEEETRSENTASSDSSSSSSSSSNDLSSATEAHVTEEPKEGARAEQRATDPASEAEQPQTTSGTATTENTERPEKPSVDETVQESASRPVETTKSASRSEPLRDVDSVSWPYDASFAQRSLPVAIRRGSQYYEATTVNPFNGDDPELIGAWEVVDADGNRELVKPGDLRVRVDKGLSVLANDKDGVVISFDSSGKVVVELSEEGEQKEYEITDVKPAPAKPVFQVGDRVQVRDHLSAEWKTGTVNATEPSLLVKVDNWKRAHAFMVVRFQERDDNTQTGSSTETEERFQEGERVEVRDKPESPWRAGTVVPTPASRTGVFVLLDNWKAAYKWNYIRKLSGGKVARRPALPPSPTDEEKPEEKTSTADDLTAIHAAWEHVCSHATCPGAGMADDADCLDEYICGNSSGCTWDETEVCRKALKLGDSVQLAPGVHEQGSLQQGEVGLISGHFEGEDQPFEVRGGYTDTYLFREDQIVPAWGRFVSWVDPKFLNPRLSFWRGHASFGTDAELMEGAKVDLRIRTPAPFWDFGSAPSSSGSSPNTPTSSSSASAPASNPVPPPPPPPKQPVSPPQTPPPAPPATPVTPPPRSQPVPVEKAPEKPPPSLKPVRIRPPTLPPAPSLKSRIQVPKKIVVHVPDMPEVCGVYDERPKKEYIRESPLYISDNCATGECSLFVSHGSFWMIGKHKADAAGNRGVVKSSEKIPPKGGRKAPPNTMGQWEFLGGAGWEVAVNGVVDVPENMTAKGYDPEGSCAAKVEEEAAETTGGGEGEAAGNAAETAGDADAAAGGGAGVEKRMDSDGNYYTKEEFLEFYKNLDTWNEKASTSKVM